MSELYREERIDLINETYKLIKESDSVAVWGMGDYAINIFAYTKISEYNISCFVDKKRFGDYFAGKVIKTPDNVKWNEIDVVVILSYYHSMEIEKDLRIIYGFNGIILKPGIGLFEREFYKYDSRSVKIINAENKKIMQHNAMFKDCYDKKRCFILGNGPSLNEHDLDKLSGEVVFAVNQFYRIEKPIKVDHYVIADPFFFDMRYYETFGKRLMIDLKKYSCGMNIIFWCPIQFKKNIEEIGFSKWANVRYFQAGRDWKSRVNDIVDFIDVIPMRNSVIQYCVFLAVYMGIKEIFLVGCEETGICGTISNYLNEGYSEYAFDIPEQELNALKDYNINIPLENILEGFAEIYRGYKEMAEFCENNNVDIYTCATKTLVSGIRKKEYRYLFS